MIGMVREDRFRLKLLYTLQKDRSAGRKTAVDPPREQLPAGTFSLSV